MPQRPAFLLCLCLATAAPSAETQPMEPQRLTGAFVTMTQGARCPSTSTITFNAQGEATGPLSGIFDMRGTMELEAGAAAGAPTIRAFTAELDVNQRRVLGSLRWDTADPALRLSCDPLGLRIEGTLRYVIDGMGTGSLEMQAYGSRSAVTMPYFGRTTLIFTGAAPTKR